MSKEVNATELAEFLPIIEIIEPVVSKPVQIKHELCSDCGWKHADFEDCPEIER